MNCLFFFFNGFSSFKPKAYVHSKFVTGLLKLFCIMFPLSESTNMDLSGRFWEIGVAHPQHLSGILFLTRLLCICRLLRAFRAAWLIHPSHLLFVLCLGDLFWVDIAYLLVCWLLGWYPNLSWDHLWAGDRCQWVQAPSGGRTLGACTKCTVGCLGKVPKVGKGEVLGKDSTRRKGYRKGWLYVSKCCLVLMSSQAIDTVFVSVLYSKSELMCLTAHVYVYIMCCLNMCTCALLGMHAQPGFCLAVGTWSFSSFPSVRCHIWWALTPPGPPCCPQRGQELGPGYGSSVHGCLVTSRPDRSNLGFVHFCLPEVPSTSGEMSGFTCTEIRGN